MIKIKRYALLLNLKAMVVYR